MKRRKVNFNLKVGVIFMMSLLFIYFTACSPKTGTQSDASEEPTDLPTALIAQSAGSQDFAERMENCVCSYDFEICPASTENGYYRVDNAGVIWYYDAQSGERAAICSDPECTHRDGSCNARITDLDGYVEYYGKFFGVLEHEDGSAEIIGKTLPDGETETVQAFKSDDLSYECVINGIADGKAVVRLISYPKTADEVERYNEMDETLYLCDLKTGDLRQMFPDEDVSLLSVRGFSSNYAVVLYTEFYDFEDFLEDFQSVEDFAAEYGTDADVSRYMDINSRQELRLYDLKDYSYKVITDNVNGDFRPYNEKSFLFSTYGYDVAYQDGDALYAVNAETGESRKLLGMAGVTDYRLFDNKVFFASNGQSDVTALLYPNRYDKTFYYADLDGGKPIKLENEGKTDDFVFYPESENANYFFDRKGKMIGKSDFYEENYSAARW